MNFLEKKIILDLTQNFERTSNVCTSICVATVFPLSLSPLPLLLPHNRPPHFFFLYLCICPPPQVSPFSTQMCNGLFNHMVHAQSCPYTLQWHYNSALTHWQTQERKSASHFALCVFFKKKEQRCNFVADKL